MNGVLMWETFPGRTFKLGLTLGVVRESISVRALQEENHELEE